MKSIFLIFGILVFAGPSSEAQSSCEGTLAGVQLAGQINEDLPSLGSIRAIEAATKPVASAISIIYNSTAPVSSFLDLQKQEILRLQEEAYSRTIESALKEFGISYQTEYLEIRDLDNASLHGIPFKSFVIQAGAKTPINRFARGLLDKHKIRLVYSPALSMGFGFLAAFDYDNNAYILGLDAIVGRGFANALITSHEIAHGLFLAERNGSYQLKVHAPVQAYLKDSSAPLEKKDIYQKFLGFDELVAYAYTLSAAAKHTIRDPRAPRALVENLNFSYKQLLDSSRRIQVESTEALKILEPQLTKHLKAKSATKLDGIEITDEVLEVILDRNRRVGIYIPFRLKGPAKGSKKKYVLDLLEHSVRELKGAILLSEFNINYLNSNGAQSNSDSRLEYLSWFRTAQVDFLEQNF